MLIKVDSCAGDQIPDIVLPYTKPCIATLADAPFDAVQLGCDNEAEVPADSVVTVALVFVCTGFSLSLLDSRSWTIHRRMVKKDNI